MPRSPALPPRGTSLGGQIQRKLQILALAALQELDDCLPAQPGQRDPVLVGESRQLRVFAVLHIDGHAILGCHWITRDLSGRTLQQTAPPCYRIRVTSSSVKRCRRMTCKTIRNASLSRQLGGGARIAPPFKSTGSIPPLRGSGPPFFGGRTGAGRRTGLPGAVGADRLVELSRDPGRDPREPRGLGVHHREPARHDGGFVCLRRPPSGGEPAARPVCRWCGIVEPHSFMIANPRQQATQVWADLDGMDDGGADQIVELAVQDGDVLCRVEHEVYLAHVDREASATVD